MQDPNQNQNQNQQKDPNVVSFMMQLVQEKYNEDVDADFLQQESDRLYDVFGNRLVNYFEPLLSQEQKVQFDDLVKQSSDQEQLLEFLIANIPNLEQQILQILVNFRQEYLSEQI